MSKADMGAQRERFWRLLRIWRKVSVPGAVALLADASMSRAGQRCLAQGLRVYVRRLQSAGYVQALPKVRGQAGTGYVLVRDTGQLAPVYQVGEMADPNTGDVHECAR